jgi:NAD-dependent deacetylase
MMKYKKIFIHSGAGLSQESGLKTFRDQNGLWENHPVEKVATPEAFEKDPDLVYRFYNLRRSQLYDEVRPNKAHSSIANFQKKYSGDLFICTQNVDNLLETAGCQKVHHMHGELSKMRCLETNQVFDAPKVFDAQTTCQCCGEPNNLRPHIVWFGEMPFYLGEIQEFLEDLELFISIGTSNQVYPAASFIQYAKQNGAHCIEVNNEKTQLSPLFNESHIGKASELLPKILEEIL